MMSKPPPSDFDVDIVLMYIDGSAPGFIESYRNTVGIDPSPCHVRTLGELRYTLRSIETSVPWRRNVYLVVQDEGHVPTWLNQDAVVVTPLRAFMPSELLPGFNPYAIQAHVHRISGLSSHFLLWSDDEFVTVPLTRRDFFSAHGVPNLAPYIFRRIPGHWWACGRFAVRMANTRQLVEEKIAGSRGFSILDRWLGHVAVPHIPMPIERSLWEKMLDTFSDNVDFRTTITSRTRDSLDPAEARQTVLELWADWLLFTTAYESWGRKTARYCWTFLRGFMATLGWGRARFAFFSVRHDPRHTASEMKRLARTRPRMFCVNDEAYDRYEDPNGVIFHYQPELQPESQRLLLETLQSLFPRPSRFETSS